MKTAQILLRDITQFTGSQYLASFVNIFRGVFIRKILGPLTMGFFTELSMFLQYGRMHDLGILNAMEREIPFYRGKSDEERMKLTQSVCFTVCLFTAIPASLLFALAAWLGPFSLSSEIRGGLYFIAVMVLTNALLSYYQILLRTYNEFSVISSVTFYGSIVETLLVVVFVYQWGLCGLLSALILGDLVWVAWALRKRPQFLKVSLVFDKQCAKALFSIGIPLSIYNFARTIFLTIDRFFILTFLGQVYLGFYSIALMVYNFMTPLPSMAYKVVYPRFMQAFGQSDSLEATEDYLTKPTLAFGYLYPLLAGLGVLALPVFLHYILPQFSEGLIPAQILLWGTCCFSLVFMWVYSIIALEKQWLMIGLTLLSALIEVGLCFLLTPFLGWGLNGIALATAVSHFFLSVFLITAVIWGHQKKGWRCVYFLVELYWPLLGTIGVVGLVMKILPFTLTSVWVDLGIFMVQAGLLLGIWGVLMFYRLNRQIPILKILKEWKSSTALAKAGG
ncbi:MAG: oligosaccharide flippase family protein [Candidatus Omnitrophica bacterium]|nr:oligosaccharide flippase family protein [Candidatus Omnitrophota bacterium]